MTSGRPRKPETDAAILDAALALFGELGSEAMTVEAVAARAGVGKATIYRRWPTKDDLVIAAIQEVLTSVAVPDLGDVRTTLVAMVRGAIILMKTSTAGLIFPRMAGEVAGRTPLGIRYVEAVIRPRRAMVRSVLERGVAEGVLRPDLDVALLADVLVGPIILRKILNELADISDHVPERLVDSLLDGWLRR
jgi:AcrR family transcriptional regulator